MAKNNFYAVAAGRQTGIFTSWDETKRLVTGYKGARFKGFVTREEAESFLAQGGTTAANAHLRDGGEYDPRADLPENYAFVDGSYNVKTKVYGYGGFLVAGGERYELSGSGDDPEFAKSRNVSGEVKGAEAAIEKAEELSLRELTIFYDYEGIRKWALNEWKANKALTKEYKAITGATKVRITFVHCAGHTGIPGNEQADILAKQAVGN